MEEKQNSYAYVGYILGIVSIIAWFLPIVGIPITIFGLTFSILGRKSILKRRLAKIGIVLNSIFLVITVINAVLGALMGTGII